MKRIIGTIAIISLGILGWAVAQEQKAEPANDTTPAFTPTESIRPDQGVAFPVDI